MSGTVEFPNCHKCQENENFKKTFSCLKVWLANIPEDWLREYSSDASLTLMQSMIASMRHWLLNIPEDLLLGEIEDDEKVGDLSLPPIQSNCPGLKEDPGDQGDLGDPEDHDDHEYLGDPGDPEDHGDPGDHEDHEMQHDSWTEEVLGSEEVESRLDWLMGIIEIEEEPSEEKDKKAIKKRFKLPNSKIRSDKGIQRIGRNYKCNECDFVGIIQKELKEHMRTHTENRPRAVRRDKLNVNCDECGFVATRPQYLKSHIDTKHKGITYPCDLCNKSYSRPSELKRHQNVHSGILFSCNECSYSSHDKGNLKKHTDSEHEGIVYPCNECDKTFKKAYDLANHMKIHEGNEFPCDVCHKVYFTSKILKVHKKCHEGIHPCNQCGFETTTVGNLKVHKKRMHLGQ